MEGSFHKRSFSSIVRSTFTLGTYVSHVMMYIMMWKDVPQGQEKDSGSHDDINSSSLLVELITLVKYKLMKILNVSQDWFNLNLNYNDGIIWDIIDRQVAKYYKDWKSDLYGHFKRPGGKNKEGVAKANPPDCLRNKPH